MAKKTILERVEARRAKIARLRAKIEAEAAMIKAIQSECDHRNSYKTSCMGDTGTYCPDCGRST